MKKSRVIIGISIAVFAVVLVPLMWAKDRTPAQKKAASNCDNRFQADLSRCRREHPELSERECTEAAAKGWHVCMQSAGLAREAIEPPQSGGGTIKPPDDGGSKIHHHVDGTAVPLNPSAGTTNSSPSPTAKPKPSRPPSHRG